MENIDFLNSIYKTSEMGIIGINDIIDKVKKEAFRDELDKQRNEYDKIMKKAEKLFNDYGAFEKELGTFVKANSKVMSEMKLMANNSDEKIAKMMMEGTNKGIIKINKGLNENKNNDKEIIELANELITQMEENQNNLKEYL